MPEVRHSRPVAVSALLATCLLWGTSFATIKECGTILCEGAGTPVSDGFGPLLLTALRFTLALPVLIVILLAQEGAAGFTHYRFSDFVPNLLAIAIVPGLLALLLYYRALSKTPASLATIAEMAYPVAATLIASGPPPWGFSQPLYPAQIVGTALLIGVIFVLGWTKEKAPPVAQAAPLELAAG